MRATLLLLLAVAACASPAAERESRVLRRYRSDAGYPSTGLPPSIRSLLADRGWSGVPRDELAAHLEAAAQGDPAVRLDVADYHLLTGGAAGALHAARNAWTWMEGTPAREGPDWDRALRIYNAAVSVHVLANAPVPSGYDGVLASPDVPIRGFRERVTRAGLGASILAIRAHSEERDEEEPYWPPIDVGQALTAVLRFDGPRPSLQLHDPLVEETVPAFGERLPLAADFTAPLAYLYEQVDERDWQKRTTRNPSFDDAGLVLLEPVRRHKIPVVFLHGLNANPADFRWMVNELRADPEIRRRYQFIAYRYPSTLPLPVLALDLRDRLARFWTWFDGRAPEARRDGYVLVGHSLGGLLAKTLAVRSGDGLFRAVFRVPREEVDLSGELGESLSAVLFLEPDPKVARLVFLAVPHRGSRWAERGTAELALNAIRMPEELAEARDAIEKRWGPQLRPEVRRRLYNKTTVIENLRYDDNYLLALSRLRIEAPYDSVIGNLAGATAKPTTDGIVTYESAHLDGADSETVVRSGHNVHQTKHGIAAVREILKRNLSE